MNTQQPAIAAWWFEPAGGVLGYGDGRAPEAGVTHTVTGTPELCAHGLHASVRLLDALKYAQSNTVWRVRISCDVQHGDDKIAGTQREYLKRYDIEDTLREFARHAALRVLHLWDAPPVVREFLETGDESLRAAARDAAGAAARDAAGDAAWDAAGDAAWAAARDAAWAAAGAAAWDALNTELERMVLALDMNKQE